MIKWPRHPDYSKGFFDARDGKSIPPTASEPYKAGWEGYQEVREIMKGANLHEAGDGTFGTTFTIPID